MPQRNPLETNFSICICYEDAQTVSSLIRAFNLFYKGDAWPCYPATTYSAKTCLYCSNSKTCLDPDGPPNTTYSLNEPSPRECICQSVSHHCMVKVRLI